MQSAWRIATAKARFKRSPRQAIRGIASVSAFIGIFAAIIGISRTANAPPGSTGYLVAVWLLLAVGTVVVGCLLWVLTVSDETNYQLADIETSRLTIRGPVPADAVSLKATIDDAMRASNGWNERDAWELIDMVAAGHMTPGLFVFVSRCDATVIGGATMRPVGDDTSPRCLGWWIGPGYRGAGYASEAVAALVDAIHNAGWASVEISTSESNLAVQRICNKIGARETYRRPQQLPDGSTVPAIRYEHRRPAEDST